MVRGALKYFIYGFGIQLLIKNVGLIARPKRLLSNLVKASMLMDCTKFALFGMCFNILYKFILCSLRRCGSKDDAVNAPIAGFFSALCIVMDSKSRRLLLTVLMMSRALDASIKLAESRGVIPQSQLKDVLIWICINIFLQSCMAMT